MMESEMEALVERLVPEFEMAKLEAMDARDEYLALSMHPAVDGDLVATARRHWQELEAVCVGILRRIDALAECAALPEAA
jgi:hypothetical protein